MTREHTHPCCLIVGASHAGVTAAFGLRQLGWQGEIVLLEKSANWPHQKPPLSKGFLLGKTKESALQLKSEKAFADNNISVNLHANVEKIDKSNQQISVNGQLLSYDKLILATGASAFIPPIKGIDSANHVLTMRDLTDANSLKTILADFSSCSPNVVVIGAGYIGLEGAAALKTTGANVTVLERESRILARVTSQFTSAFVQDFHEEKGVDIHLNQQVESILQTAEGQVVACADGSHFLADIILVGVGVRVNQSLAKDAELKIDNGVVVDETCQTSDEHIYAIGDCTRHFNHRYNLHVRLESVQNAVDQAKVAASNICSKPQKYDKLPWFWSDQFNMKLQIAGLSSNQDDVVVRRESDKPNSVSLWYFNGDELRCVEAINNPKAYVMATRLMQEKVTVNKEALADSDTPLNLDLLKA